MINLLGIIKQRGLPSITVGIGALAFLALMDSASSLNLLKEEVLDKCLIGKDQIRKSAICIKGINGKVSKAIGEIKLNISIMDRDFDFTFTIMSDANFPTPILLGYNALHAAHLVTNFQTGKVWFSNSDTHDGHDSTFAISSRVGDDSLVVVNESCKGKNDAHNSSCASVEESLDDSVNVQVTCGSDCMTGTLDQEMSNVSVVRQCIMNTWDIEFANSQSETDSFIGSGPTSLGVDNSCNNDIAGCNVADVTESADASGNISMDSFVCMDECTKRNVYVRKQVKIEIGSLVKVDIYCPNVSNHSCLCVLGDSCKVRNIQLDNTIVQLQNQEGFVFVVNSSNFEKVIEADVLLAEAVVLSHDIVYCVNFTPGLNDYDVAHVENYGEDELILSTNESSVTKDLFDTSVNNDAPEPSSYEDKLKAEAQTIDFPEYRNQLIGILRKYRKAVAVKGDTLGKTSLIKHKIELLPGTRPRYIPAYRMPHSRKAVVQELVEVMEEQGVISPSSSPYNSPLILVPKRDGGFRPYIDFRRLNEITIPDRYPMPVLSEVLSNLGGMRVFSTLDMLSGFWQIKLEEESKPLTAFSTQNGHFHFNCMPFGLRNSPITFVRLMNMLFPDMCNGSLLTYIDDLIVFSKTVEDHLNVLESVLDRLAKNGLKLKLSKCQFLKRQLDFLGHVVSDQGISVQEAKIVKIKEFSTPKTEKSLKRFLGMCGYYRPYIKHFASITEPLTRLLSKSTDFLWGKEQDEAFNVLKEKLMTAPILTYPDFSKPFIIACDASDCGIGSVLLQKGERRLLPIAYASKTLSSTERRYSVTEREALAVVWSLKKFRDYCLGYPVTIYTDHMPVCDLFRNRQLHGKLARWFLQVQEFEPNIRYIPGSKSTLADWLSRMDEDTSNDFDTANTFVIQEVELDLELFRTEQIKERIWGRVIEDVNKGKSADEFVLINNFCIKEYW